MSDEKTDHDGAYKKLFSNRDMVRALIEHHFDEEFAQALDFEEMKSLNVEFRVGTLFKRDGDLIWEIPGAAGEKVYVFLMLEFQSSVDETMAVRVLVYVAMLYEHLLTQGHKLNASKLPPVLPFVIYNGAREWNAATNTLECIDVDASSALRDYQPDLTYYLIDIGRRERVENHSDIEDPVSLLFELERVRSREELRPLLEHMADMLEVYAPGFDELFGYWFTRVLRPREGFDAFELEDFDYQNLEPTMLREIADRWYEEAAREGREEGREEGRREVLMRFLESRFGPNDARTERVNALTLERLDAVLMRFVESPDATEDALFELEGE